LDVRVFFLRVYVLAVACFGVFRLLALWLMRDHAAALPEDERVGLISGALLMGLRFDTVIACYLLAVPLFFSGALHWANGGRRIAAGLTMLWLWLWFPVAFFVCAADIPFFAQGFGRLNAFSVKWEGNDSFVIGMVLEEFRYWWPVIPWLIITALFVWLTGRWSKQIREPKTGSLAVSAALWTLMLLGCFVGIRGRVALKSPIRTGTAYFSAYAFPNELGLNPVFTFMRSWLDQRKAENRPLALMDDTEAVRMMRQYLGLPPDSELSIERMAEFPADTALRMNIILVIMESMSAAKTGYLGGTRLTPVLDSLHGQSLSFTRALTEGIHTYNGVYSTLISWPTVGMRHPMKQTPIVQYHGMASALKQHGYQTVYFTTHDGQFDNAAGFLTANGFDRVVAQDDYPSERILSTLGVPDDFMFEFAMPQLDDARSPFFAAFMTASDHGPYIVPSYFTPQSEDIKQQVVEYADWSLGRLIEIARKQPWFERTVFVFVADHGAAMEYAHEMPLSYHHTPLIFHAPGVIAPEIRDELITQADIYPTLMGLLRLAHRNVSFGRDVLAPGADRAFVCFSADDRTAVLSPPYYYIVRPDGSDVLHLLPEGHPLRSEGDSARGGLTEIADFSRWSKARLQTVDYLLRSGKTK
jgi:phosphoglycerol transferase MdoB-like AlkP superfamily enzyme